MGGPAEPPGVMRFRETSARKEARPPDFFPRISDEDFEQVAFYLFGLSLNDLDNRVPNRRFAHCLLNP